MARKKSKSEFPFEFVQGGEAAPAGVVKKGMTEIERRLDKKLRERLAARAEEAPYQKLLRSSVLKAVGEDDQLSKAVRGFRQANADRAKQKLAAPRMRRLSRRNFLASIGLTRVPPYDWPWSWSATSGSPSVSVGADQNAGQISFALWTDLNNSSSASAAAALGIFFRPLEANGILQLSSNPAINFGWGTWSVLDSSHSDGWIGLIAEQFTLAGGMDAVPVDQQISLWNDNSWWQGAGWNTGSNSGFPLFAQFTVDSDHWYALWVWCGGSVSADGWGNPFWGSGAGSTLSVGVPSISWELF